MLLTLCRTGCFSWASCPLPLQGDYPPNCLLGTWILFFFFFFRHLDSNTHPELRGSAESPPFFRKPFLILKTLKATTHPCRGRGPRGPLEAWALHSGSVSPVQSWSQIRPIDRLPGSRGWGRGAKEAILTPSAQHRMDAPPQESLWEHAECILKTPDQPAFKIGS